MNFAVDANSNYVIPDYLRQYIPWNFTNIPRVSSPLPVYAPNQVQSTTGREGDLSYSILPQYLSTQQQSDIAGGIGAPPTVNPLNPAIAGMSGYTTPDVLALGGSLFQRDPTSGQITGYPQGMNATQIDALLNQYTGRGYSGGGQVFDPTDPIQLRDIIVNSAPDDPIGTSFGNLLRAASGFLSGGGTEAGGALGTAIGSATGDPNAKLALGAAGRLGGGLVGASNLSPILAGAGMAAEAATAPTTTTNLGATSAAEALGEALSAVNPNTGQLISSVNPAFQEAAGALGGLDAAAPGASLNVGQAVPAAVPSASGGIGALEAIGLGTKAAESLGNVITPPKTPIPKGFYNPSLTPPGAVGTASPGGFGITNLSTPSGGLGTATGDVSSLFGLPSGTQSAMSAGAAAPTQQNNAIQSTIGPGSTGSPLPGAVNTTAQGASPQFVRNMYNQLQAQTGGGLNQYGAAQGIANAYGDSSQQAAILAMLQQMYKFS